MNQLTQEISQSSNIKSPTTRKNVQAALRKIIQYLKITNFNIPTNGIVLFSGNTSEIEGKQDIKLKYIVPIKEIKSKIYWCDSTYHTKLLDEMLIPEKIYGIITVDNRNATLAILNGKKYNIVSKLSSNVPGKTKAGGQSALRFERLRTDAENEFYTRISERINKEFLPYLEKLEGIIIGGPGNTKNKMVDRNDIDYRLKNKILGYIDITYTDESGIKELLDSSEDLLKDTELKKEQNIINDFMKKIVTNGLATYGFKEVLKSITSARAKKITISDNFKEKFVKIKCNKCDKISDVYLNNLKCIYCNSNDVEIIEDIDPIEFFSEQAKKIKASIIVVSNETSEGEQFLKGFGGLGAFLRY